MEHFDIIGKDIDRAAELLLDGHLVGMPTETVYGLAAVATDERAVTKIFRAKGRPHFDPLICHFYSVEQVANYVLEIPKVLHQVMHMYMPGPVTVLLDRKMIIPDLVTSGLSRVAARIPSHEMARELLRRVAAPVAAPSANPFGYISPTTTEHVAAQLGDKVSYILDGGACHVGVESTIVGVEEDSLVVYRKGGLSIEKLLEIDSALIVREHSSSNPAAPGMLKSHYAPRKEVLLIDDINDAAIDWDRAGLLTFSEFTPMIPKEYQYALSEVGDYAEAARHLFGAMRMLDQQDIDRIYVQLLPEEDLGRAINDRLRRAAAQ